MPGGREAVPNAEAVLRVRPQQGGGAFPLDFQERAESQTFNTPVPALDGSQAVIYSELDYNTWQHPRTPRSCHRQKEEP